MNKLGNYSRNETDYDGPNDRHWAVLPLKATTTTLWLMIAEIKRGHRDGEGRRSRYGTKHWGALCSHSCMNTEARDGISKAGFFPPDFDAISAVCCGVTLAVG